MEPLLHEPPEQVASESLDRTNRFSARCSFWFSEAARPSERQRLADELRALFHSFWRGDERDEKGRILSAQFPSLQDAFEETLREWSVDGTVALLFADIDNFKAFNDQFGPQEGDRLIAKLSAVLQQSAPPSSIVIHRTGDEFLVAYPATSAADSTLTAINLRSTAIDQLVADEAPLKGEKQLNLSMGVAEIDDQPQTYRDLEQRAERSLKPGGSEKRRGRVSLEHTKWPESTKPAVTGLDVQAALVFALSLTHSPCPFFSTWANALSLAAERAATTSSDLQDLRSNVHTLIRKINPDIKGVLAYSPSWDVPATSRGDEQLGTLDVTLAISHGLARARLSGKLSLDVSLELVVSFAGDVSCIIAGREGLLYGEPLHGADSAYRIVVVPAGQYREDHEYDTRSAIHVTIGPNDIGLPLEMFAEQVFVDERPTGGGGLPDFWEAAVAQVIAALVRYPNVNLVLVSGKSESGFQTLSRLQAANQWIDANTADDLADKLGFRTATIRTAGQRISSNVHLVVDAAQALDLILVERGRRRVPYQATVVSRETHHDPPRLKRTLNMEELALGPEAGCRVGTAYEAFPVALELTRRVEDVTGFDQAGRAFKELVDFRIILAQPQVDRIPRFHLRERDEFERYFQNQFVATTGLFNAALSQNDQLNLVVRHIAEVVDQGGRTSSRRGTLVVPHAPEPHKSLAPLGLLTVRIIPRSSADAGGSTLDYSFTWRTVEALVGLPYSLYGSIRFAEYLTELVRGMVHPTNQRSLRMGQLSYIAHSLHIFLDEYHQKIARRVVNDDTR